MKNGKLYKLTFALRKLRSLFYQKYNIFCLKIAGVSLGQNANITNKIHTDISSASRIVIGDNIRIFSGDGYNAISKNIRTSIRTEANASIEIGNNVGMSSTCLWAYNSIKIGNYVQIGANCTIIDSDCHDLRSDFRRLPIHEQVLVSKPIVIEDDVMIGCNCTILKGVVIGKGSVIGAGSVVSKDIPCNCIAAGNPCRIIKQMV